MLKIFLHVVLKTTAAVIFTCIYMRGKKNFNFSKIISSLFSGTETSCVFVAKPDFPEKHFQILDAIKILTVIIL